MEYICHTFTSCICIYCILQGFIWDWVGKLIFSDLNVRMCALTLNIGRVPGRKDDLAVTRRGAGKYTARFFCNHDMSELPSHR